MKWVFCVTHCETIPASFFFVDDVACESVGADGSPVGLIPVQCQG